MATGENICFELLFHSCGSRISASGGWAQLSSSLHVSDPKGSKRERGTESSFSLTSIFSPNGPSRINECVGIGGLVCPSAPAAGHGRRSGRSEIDAHIRISTYNKSRRDYKTRVWFGERFCKSSRVLSAASHHNPELAFPQLG